VGDAFGAGASDGGADGDGDDGSSDDGSGPKYDVGEGTGGPGDEEEGCEKVDFLFVIDSSGSMGNNQTNLIQSFPGFIETIQTQIKGQDHHIMAVDTDAEDICDGTCGEGSSFCALGGFDCEDVPTLGGCDVELGAGNLRDTNKELCAVDGGRRYMTHEQTDLEGTFACVARTGTYGFGDEQAIGAMSRALGDELNQGGCNDGFLREDAVLVLTVVTDAPPDTASEQVTGEPAQWRDVVVAAKGGHEKHITVLGLVSDGDLPGGMCSGMPDDSARGSPKMREFVGLFTHNVLASVCEPSYNAFFDQAVQVVDTACDDYVPPG
jgi:hypothetical protein